MAPEQCQHLNRVKGLFQLDFAHPAGANGPYYSASVSARICEDCGYIELYCESLPQYRNWLKAIDDSR